MCYQTAIILVELPAWGEMPRMLTTEAETECETPRKEMKINKGRDCQQRHNLLLEKECTEEGACKQQQGINLAANDLDPKSMLTFLQLIQTFCRRQLQKKKKNYILSRKKNKINLM